MALLRTIGEQRSNWLWAVGLVAVGLLMATLPGAATAQTLIGSPFLTSYDGWTDTYDYGITPPQGYYPAWGVLLERGVLMENSDGMERQGGYDAPREGNQNDGEFIGYKMINSNTTSSAYTITGTYSITDDDGQGMIFGYQDEDNYFRVGTRRQSTGAYGFYQGLTVSKVVGGVITPYIGGGPTTSFIPLMNDSRFSLKVKVDGDAFEVYAWRTEGGREPSTPQISGTDSDLATLGAGQYGTMSWGSRGDEMKGDMLHSMTVDNGSNGSIDTTHAFDTASPVAWRRLAMTNAENLQEANVGQDGNFALDFRDGTIQEDSNAYEWATSTAPNVDFIGSAIVVDEASAQTIGDMEMKVRIACNDNEGPGLLFRVQDDKTFYRVNWATEATGTAGTRAPQGMSIQKCVDDGSGAPTWTELYSETAPAFAYSADPFDVKITVTNDVGGTTTTINVEVIDPLNPDFPIVYDTVVDSSDPLLYGTVGFTNWGGGRPSAPGAQDGVALRYSGYGGDPNAALVVVPGSFESAGVPEPGTLVLLLGAAGALAVFRRRSRVVALLLAVLCLTMPLAGTASAATLIDTPFITGYDGWTDTNTSPIFVGSALPMWGVLINNNALCDVSNGAVSSGGTYDGGVAGDSQYKPYMIVNTNYATPSQYTLTGTLSATDDDGLGLIFGYQDNDNYCRIGMRLQDTGDNGFAKGISFDKVVGGVITQVAIPDATFAYVNDNTPFDLKVEVNGTACTVTGPSAIGGTPTVYFSGSVPELATLGHNYGVMNWQSRFDTDYSKRAFGAQLHSLTVDEGSDGSIERTHSFENASPQPWRELYMTNALGNQLSLEYDKGNFRVEVAGQGIVDDSNPYENATTTAPAIVDPNVDFIGSAIAIDNAATLTMDDYEMQVRMECGDNEGPGLLVRVQDDNTFYRINFAAEATGTDGTRPPIGMSIQKCDGRGGGVPVWTELYSETVDPFVYTNHVADGETFPFDVKVSVVNNSTDTATTIHVDVIDDPEESATPYSWDVVDSSDPILTGTVGLTNWAAGNLSYGRSIGVKWSGYGGDVNAPLVVDVTGIPEIPGDATRDGTVDEDDAIKLAQNWGATGGWDEGDFDGDTIVGPKDAAIMAANWGYVWPGEEASAVPEPGTLMLLSLLALCGLAMRRRK
ncbi:MAG: PEP-CTERM sorting domain-containing protein [Pirellulales bacterium]|nr:PEP-CTERM sorting domain-containing protein [Pirellulales bacterium]